MKHLSLLFALLFTVGFGLQAQERYLDEVFTDVTVTNDLTYGVNATVLLITDPQVGEAVPQELKMDFYEPTGDTEEERPLIIYLHTGNFLPQPEFCSIGGNRDDEVVVEICTRLAKRGYAVAVIDYRQGWNPIASTQDERTFTLINAAYRGVQDARTAVRFFRKDAAENSNSFGIDTTRITLFGQGTGGYISLAAATLTQYSDVLLPKFTTQIPGIPTPIPMVLEPVNGDIYGTSVGIVPPGSPPPFTAGDTLCYPNHVGYSSDVHLAVNMGGALADTSWMDPSDPPIISFHVPNDSLAPYQEGVLIVPTTGDLVVEVQGSYTLQQKAQEIGLNASFDLDWNDEFTAAANEANDGAEGLFPFRYPSFPDPQNPGDVITVSAPWEWWNPDDWDDVFCDLQPGIPLNLIGLAGNPQMSEMQGMAYVDSIMGFFLPRACAALDLGCDLSPFTSTKDVISADFVDLNVSPNPAQWEVTLRSDREHPILDVEVYDLSGRLVNSELGINSSSHTVQRDGLPSGFYLLRVRFEEGFVTQKLFWQ
jgi:hypothetical protein